MKRIEKITCQTIFDFLTLCHHNNNNFISEHQIVIDENGFITKTHLLQKLEQHFMRTPNPLNYITNDPRFELTDTSIKLSQTGINQTKNHFPLMVMPIN